MVATIEEYEEDYEEDDVSLAEPSGSYCVQCAEALHLAEEVFLLRLVHAYVVEGKLHHVDVLNEEGNFLYEPAFYCFDCCEEALEEVTTLYEDAPPVLDPAGIILCDLCQSDILPGELVGLAEFGELQWSERSPNSRHSPVFVQMDDRRHICIGCLQHLEEERERKSVV